MQSMVDRCTGSATRARRAVRKPPVDMMALLESLQADNREQGRTIDIEGRARRR